MPMTSVPKQPAPARKRRRSKNTVAPTDINVNATIMKTGRQSMLAYRNRRIAQVHGMTVRVATSTSVQGKNGTLKAYSITDLKYDIKTKMVTLHE